MEGHQLIQQLAIKDIIIHFERIFNLILPSQVELLWRFKQKNVIGLGILELEEYFNNLKLKVPLVFSNWTWQGYISFLYQENLIAMPVNSNPAITEYGNAFLQYMLSMNYQKFGDF